MKHYFYILVLLTFTCCKTNTSTNKFETITKTENNILNQTMWELVDISTNESLPIHLGKTFLKFESGTFIINLCHKTTGNYRLANNNTELTLNNVKKGAENFCAEKTASAIGTSLPNIAVAEKIIALNKFKITLEENILTLNNKEGKLTFKRFNLQK